MSKYLLDSLLQILNPNLKYLKIYGMAAFFQNSKKLGIVCSLNVVPGHVVGDTCYLYIAIIVKAKVGLF